ncbi:S-layer domain protein [Halorubrum sp. DM2]|uniref:hypothetical protein n=1 Tax=Halorubrum sp. DM2 TaxID=2527867 RepID=UPI0024B83396|nr:hypothetical protein [Halorubrum sp. DM2]VTT86104.1 S-layer domain protein [Halorubrum sp. DM2]
MNTKLKRSGFAALIALTMLLSVVATPVAAAGDIGWGDDAKTPNPTIEADVTVDEWDNSEFSSALEYYDDAGDAATLPASVNESNDNPVTLTATDIDFDERNEFPRNDDEDGENSASALDDSEWTVSGATVSSTTTAPGVDALNYAGTATSDSATYSNFSVADGEKSYITLAADINSATGTPTLQLVDGDGDYVEVTLYDATATASDDNVLANSTGEGKVLQHQVGDLTVQGSGDGTFGSAEEITISGDIDADVSVLDAERTRELTFGERLADTDDDDELETVTITEPRGAYSVTGMDTLDAVMSDATIFGITVDAEFEAADLRDDADVSAEFSSSNDYPQWDQFGELAFRLELPTAFDLSYSDTELVDEPSLPSERYKNVEVAEDTGDTEFSEIESYTSVTSSYDGSEEISLDATVSTDTSYVVAYDVVLTNGEVSAIQSAADGGGAAIMSSNGGGFLAGIWGFVTKPFGAIVSAISGIGLFSLFRGGS